MLVWQLTQIPHHRCPSFERRSEMEYVEIPGTEHELVGLPSVQGVNHAVAFLENWVK